jgi:hypothetical protein
MNGERVAVPARAVVFGPVRRVGSTIIALVAPDLTLSGT